MNYPDHFLRLLLHLQYTPEMASNWEKFCYYSFLSQPATVDRIPYTIGHLLEPGLVDELALLTHVPAHELEFLNYETQGPISVLKDMLTNTEKLNEIQKINLCLALNSLARYVAAKEVFDLININNLKFQEKFYYYNIQLLFNDVIGSINTENTFFNLKNILEINSVPEEEIVTTCASVILYGNKGAHIIKNNLFEWFIDSAKKYVKTIENNADFHSLSLLSGFYRVYAMTLSNNLQATRQSMQLALNYAMQLQPSNLLEEAVKTYYIRTNYQSTLKEHMFLTHDYEKAEEAIIRLIEVDKNFSVSYIEAAEFYLHRKQYEKALEYYQRANIIGPPRYIYSQFMLGFCYEQLNDYDQAINQYQQTLLLDPSNVSSAVNGYLLAKKQHHNTLSYFKSLLQIWNQKNLLPSEALQLVDIDSKHSIRIS
ncbi:MAG: hypothetical protein A3F17_07510 [Gammaproteobacteria bacterium RIFCSPHIGHO2_12_FULL_41_15]|nr:MAG: hypothetical protein A3F17_07510 [Gammaproteobacteria bacterium RIFCSPHIGHO2_12_FULL_41_15]